MPLARKIVPMVIAGSLAAEAYVTGRRDERESPHVDPPEHLYPSPVGNCAISISVTSSSASSVFSGYSWSAMNG
jgi:hypothetical protein